MFRSKAKLTVDLKKSAQTPHGAIWSCQASMEEMHRLSEGQLVDPQGLLVVGDIITVRQRDDAGKKFSMRVIDRGADVVQVRKIRH